MICAEIKDSLQFIEKTRKHIFVTGKAGTGKSTLVRELKRRTAKNIALLAPTGVAAVNVSGQTIHSFFGFKPGMNPDAVQETYKNKKLYKSLDAIVIDEISMVRADLFDSIGLFLKKNGPKNKIFGGVQIIMVGDLYQLPPVLTSDEKSFFEMRYSSPYFFSSRLFKKMSPELVKLRTIHRQSEKNFISLLNKIRSGQVTKEDLSELNRNTEDNFSFGKDKIFLTTTNRKANKINAEQLSKIKGREIVFSGKRNGSFPKSYLPTAEKLKLKIGAQVMLLNNDKEKRWINGDVGKVIHLQKDPEMIKVELKSGRVVKVQPYEWSRVKYKYDRKNDRIKADKVGVFKQLPIRLSWATTIHKAQGKTFEEVMIDFGRGTFSHGQAYVALSRCKNLEGLSLKRPIRRSDIIVDRRVVNFLKKIENEAFSSQNKTE